MKKRILSVLLAALMVLGSVGTFAFGAAAEGEFTIELVVGDIQPDGTVHADVMMSNNPGIAGLEFTVGFDATKIQLVGCDTVWNDQAYRYVVDTVLYGTVETKLTETSTDISTLDYFNLVYGTTSNFMRPSGKLMGVTFKVVGDFESTDLTFKDTKCFDQNRAQLTPTFVNDSIGLPEITGLSFAGATYTYDGQPKNLAVAGDTTGMNVDYDVKDAVDAAEYTVTATVTKAGFRTWKKSATLKIEPKALTVSGLKATNKVYDATTTVALDDSAMNVAGIVAGDDVSVVVPESGTTANANVGKNLAVSYGNLTLEGADKANYTVANPNVTVNVDTLKVTVTPKAGQGKKLGENDPAIEYTTSVDVRPLGANITGALDRVRGEDAGEISKDYEIIIGSLACDDANIELVFTEGVMFTIHAKEVQEVVMNAVPEAVTFGDAGFEIGATVTKGTSNAPTYTTSNANVLAVDADGKVTIVGAGTATITVTVAGDDTYAERTIELPITVAKKKVTVTPTEATVTYGDTIEVAYTYDVDGVTISGDAAVASKNAGRQAITKGDLTIADANYELVFVSGKYITIEPKTIDVTVELWPVMAGETPEIKTDVAPVVNASQLVGSDSVTVGNVDVATVGAKNGDVYQINGLTSSNSNYVLNATGTAVECATEAELAGEVADELAAPSIDLAPNATTIDLSDINNDLPYSFEWVVVGSDNTDVIDANGGITAPESDVDVNVDLELYYNGQPTGQTTTVKVTVPAVKSNTMLQMLLLYYHKKNQKVETVATVKTNVATGTEVIPGTKIELSTATAGATIYYTVDGSAPTVLDKVYTGPITVNADMTISAIATKSGMKSSAPVSYKYTVDGDYITLKADAANIKYMDGYADGTFKPTQDATRYEVVAALANVFDIVSTASPKALTDVSADYKAVVDSFTAAGIIDGYTDGTFRGTNPIKRSEVAKIICVMMGLDADNAKDAGFKDVDGWAEKYINACAEAGYVQGKGEGEFAPDEYITRAQLAKLINNITGAKDGTSCSYSDVTDTTAWYYGPVAAAAK